MKVKKFILFSSYRCDSASFIVHISSSDKRVLRIKYHRESVICPFISRSKFHIQTFGAIIHTFLYSLFILFLYIPLIIPLLIWFYYMYFNPLAYFFFKDRFFCFTQFITLLMYFDCCIPFPGVRELPWLTWYTKCGRLNSSL